MYRPFLLLSLFFLSVLLKAQCPPTGDPIVIVNEVGNFGVNAEYVEILVVGYPGNPYAKVDMRDWILNDNNYTAIDHGNEPGHLRFGDCFDAVAPGTLIVIYNEKEPAAVVTGANALAYPGNSACLQGFEGFPNHSASNHAMTHPVSPNWLDLVPLRNLGDGIQILDANESPRHAVFWGDCSFGGAVRMPMQGLSAQGQAFLYMGGMNGWQSASNYVSSATGSPGAPNSSANAVFIESLLNGNGAQLSVSCKEKKAASGPYNADGEGQITITGGQSMVTVTVVNPQNPSFYRSYSIQQAGEIILDNLLPGTYRVKAVEVGGCEANCEFQVSFKNKAVIQVCSGDCVTLGEDFDPNLCYSWMPSSYFGDPFSRVQVICPRIGLTNIGVVATDASGQVIMRKEYDFEIIKMFVSIEKSWPEVLCPGGTVVLKATEGFDSYVWTNDNGTTIGNGQTLVVSQEGTYTVTVRKAACTRSASANVAATSLPPLLVTPNPAILCGETVTLSASGNYNEYYWSINGNPLGVGQSFLTWQPGTYSLLGWHRDGCSQTTTVEVSQAIQGLSISPNPAVICRGDGVQLAAPAGFISYRWDDAPLPGSSDRFFTASTPGTHRVTVSDANGCIASASILVSEAPASWPSIGPANAEICQTSIPAKPPTSVPEADAVPNCPNQTLLSVLPGPFVAYTWSNQSTTPTISVTTAGIYTVTVRDAYGCTAAVTKTVKPCFGGNAHLNLTDGNTKYICAPNGVALLDAGNGFETYSWSTGQTIQSIQVNQSGQYTVTVFSGGCSAKVTVEVIQLSVAPQLDLEIYKPGVLAPTEPMVPDATEETVGAMTFVNIDNDDEDRLPDLTDDKVFKTGGVVKDDELVKLKLKSNIASSGAVKVRLRAVQGGNFIKIYKSPDKSAGVYTLDSELTLSMTDGDFKYEQLWVEGLSKHANARETILELYCDTGPDCTGTTDKVALTIIGIQNLQWIGVQNSENDDATLTPETNPVGRPVDGVKIFPDGRNATDPARTTALLRITLNAPPPEPLTIFARPFDVDDPTDNGEADQHYKDFLDLNDTNAANSPIVIKPYPGTPAGGATYATHEDNRGPGPKSGIFAGADANGIAPVVFTQGVSITTINFTVSMHPGDNYRAVVNGDKNFLNQLENVDGRDVLNVVDKNTVLSVPADGITNTLTVWRFLNVENRSMGADVNDINVRKKIRFRDFQGSANNVQAFFTVNPPNTQSQTSSSFWLDRYILGPPYIGNAWGQDPSPSTDSPIPCDGIGGGRFEDGIARLIQGTNIRNFNIFNNGQNRINIAAGGAHSLVGLEIEIDGGKVVGNMPLSTHGTIVDIIRIAALSPTLPNTYNWVVNITPGQPILTSFDFINYIKIAGTSDITPVIGFVGGTNTITSSSFNITFDVLQDDDPVVGGLLPYVQNLIAVEDAYQKVYLKIRTILGNDFGFDQNSGDVFPVPVVPGGVVPGPNATNDDIMLIESGQITNESNSFWVAYVVSAWQYTTLQDNDPFIFPNPPVACNSQERGLRNGHTDVRNGALSSGNIVKGCQSSLIFRGIVNEQLGIVLDEPTSVAHEIGHQFGLSHGNGDDGSQVINECNGPDCNVMGMGLMYRGLGNTNHAIIARYQNIIRSRVSSPGF